MTSKGLKRTCTFLARWATLANQCQPNTTLTQETLEVLPEFGIELASSQLRHRQVYRQSAVFGQTVHDFGGKPQPRSKK